MAFGGEFRKTKNYYHHDDKFCSKPFRRKNKPSRLFDLNKIRQYISEGYDIDANIGEKKHSNFRFKAPRVKHYRTKVVRKRDGGACRSILRASYYWFKVTLYHGAAYDRLDIMKKLQNYIKPVLLVPLGLRVENDNIIFFVDNKRVSDAIRYANLKLRTKDGYVMQFKVESEIPINDMNPSLKENIALVILTKYDDNTQHLDLSKFYANDEFLKQDLLVPLSIPNVASSVFEIINQRVPKLKSINLSNNKIFTTEHFSMLKTYVNDLKSIDLSRNRIHDLSELMCLEGLKLDSLVLDCNPLCNRFRDQMIYVREVRNIFPTLLFLDGVALSPPATLDYKEPNKTTMLPRATSTSISKPTTPSESDSIKNSNEEDFTRQFLEQFYLLYDNPSGNRSGLDEAYALTGEFSLTTSSFSGVNSNKFITENRDSIRVINHLEGRTELLLIGKQNIVKFLSTLPKTQHDVASFHVDFLAFTPELVSLGISGVFREAEYTPSPIKTFKREFTLISNGSGFSIVKDALCVTDSTSEQATTSFGSESTSNNQIADVSNLLKNSLCLDSDISQTTVVSSSPSTSGISLQRQATILLLSKQTKMNLLWSEKCLNETNWEYKKSIEIFTEFRKRNAIPAEAFL